MPRKKIIDYRKIIKEKAQKQASGYNEAFFRTGEAFTREHFQMSVHEFIEYVRTKRSYPPVKAPFEPFGEKKIPDITFKIWKEMEKIPAYRELLDEDPLAFLVELGIRFNKHMERKEKK